MSPEYGRFTAETPHVEADERDYYPEPDDDAYELLCKADDNLRWAKRNRDERSNYIQQAITLLMRAHTAHQAEQKARRG